MPPNSENIHTDPSPQPERKGKVDLLFLLNASASMQPVLDGLRANLPTIISTLANWKDSRLCADWRFSFCAYRDFLPGHRGSEERFILHPFTSNIEKLDAQLAAIHATGEDVEEDSLLEALCTVINRGTTQKGEPDEEDKWRSQYVSTRAVLALTNTSCLPTMQSLPGSGTQDVIELIHQTRLCLTLLGPERECIYELAQADFCCLDTPESPDSGETVAFICDWFRNLDNLKLFAKVLTYSYPNHDPYAKYLS